MSAATTERKSGQAAAALAEREARVLELNAEIANLYENEEEARFDLLMKNPGAPTTAITDEPAKLARKREKLETELSRLQKEIPSLREVEKLKRIEASQEALKENRKAAKILSDEQLEHWRRAGEQVQKLMETWAAIVAVAESHDEFMVAVEQEFTEEVRQEFRGQSNLPVQPFPMSPRAFLDVLLQGSVDPNGEGYRRGGSASSTFLSEKHLDDLDVLVTVLPDLRGQNIRPNLSGRVAKRGTRDERNA